jgi:transposase InsO family protein
MSRPGHPWENGKCESFIKTLKQEDLMLGLFVAWRTYKRPPD